MRAERSLPSRDVVPLSHENLRFSNDIAHEDHSTVVTVTERFVVVCVTERVLGLVGLFGVQQSRDVRDE
jgi:hypothetical protein